MNRQIYEEASEWLIELRVGELDGAARERLDAWLRASPQNIRAFLELSNIWEEGKDPDLDKQHSSEELIARARASSNVFDLNRTTLWTSAFPEQVRAQVAEQFASADPPHRVPEARDHSPSPLTFRRRNFLVAASLAVVAIGAAGVALYSVRASVYTTGIGEQRTVLLPDGSTVELNAQSRLRVRFTDQERDVELLDGQALFKVAKNAARPFVVKSDVARVRAVGTKFDVNTMSDGTTVTVLEGRVAVVPIAVTKDTSPESRTKPRSLSQAPPAAAASETTGIGTTESRGSTDATQMTFGPQSSGSAEVFVSAGEQVVATPSQITKPARADVAAATAWTKRELVFDSTPLTDVVAEFNRYNVKPLLVDDASLKGFHVTGVFSSTDPSSLVKFLRTQKGILVDETDRNIRIYRQ